MNQQPDISPPQWLLRFLRWFCDPDLVEDVEGDLLEIFHKQCEQNSDHAKFRFTLEVLLLFRPGIIRNFQITLNRPIMLKNYLLIALRSAKKYKGHTLLNLMSLVIGIASCILILLWVQQERSIDKFHLNENQIYKVWRNMYQANGEIISTDGIPQPLVEVLRNDYPEVEQATLISWDIEVLFKKEDLLFYETGKYASPELFHIFSFPFLVGDKETALKDGSSIVISESLAEKYFGTNWKKADKVLGQTLNIGSESKAFKVTGVFEDPGAKSSFDFDWIISAQEYIQRNDWVSSWFNGGFGICFTLRKGADITPLQTKLVQVINKNTNYDADERVYLNKFSDNYLYSNFENGRPVGGRIQYVKILFIIALFILVIACINFMNLATAQSSRRTKEIGVRKVLGARKGALRNQFFTESFILSFVAVALAVILVIAVLPAFNEITQKELALNLNDSKLWIGLILVTLITGTLSGSYPAIFLPSFKTISSLKGLVKGSTNGIRLREGLVVFQFALSILLIIGSLVVSQQMSYILNKNLGLDKENMVYVSMPRNLTQKMELYKAELLKQSEIVHVSTTSGNPLSYGRSSGSAQWEGKAPNEEIEINVLSVDTDFVPTMNMKMLEGRNFSSTLATDTANYLINEVAANIMGFDNPIDKDLTLWGLKGKIVGVVQNFHMSSMYDPIAPLIIRNDPSSTFVAFIKTQGDVPQALASIEQVTKEINPDFPFVYDFLDDTYTAAYRSEMTLKTIVNIFAFISILISCLGLLGLSSFTVEQRSKEIGIRKVYGASVFRIVSMLSWGYSKLILLAFVLAAPLTFYIMQEWLNNFEFSTNLNLPVFLLAGLMTLIIGTFVVGIKSLQAAIMSPSITLKQE